MTDDQRATRAPAEDDAAIQTPEAPDIPPPADDDRLLLPADLQTALLVGILTLLILYTLYFAREIVMPILYAFLLDLLLQPVMRLFAKLRIPSIVAALFSILLFFGSFGILFSSLAGPATDWFGKLSQSLPRIEERLSVLKIPLERLHQANAELNKLANSGGGNAMSVVVQGDVGGYLVSNTGAAIAGLLTTVVVLFFLLVSGDLFLRKLVEVLPRFRDKKRAVAISQEVERNISAYLVTITIMNALVGVGVSATAWLSGLGDALLWGALAFFLNYIPILGPLVGVLLVFLGGMLAFETIWQAVLIAGVYLGIHFLEGEFVTPVLIARRFTVNPVLVIVSLVFWYWMWGVPGAIMAMPLLATVKIICDHVRPLRAFGHFLGG
jgi:predicted PurR-regulated permease PerM